MRESNPGIIANVKSEVNQPISPSTQTFVGSKTLLARLDFFKQVRLFAGLTRAELTTLAQDFVRREFKPAEVIFQQGDPGQVLYLIENGQVRIFVHGSDGQETSVVLYGPGDIFGELAVIDSESRSAGAVAMEDTLVYLLNRERFNEHMRRMPQLALNFMRALSSRVRYSTEQVGSLASLDVPKRLARKLLELAKQYGVVEPNGVRLHLTLTQTDLASLTGATRESVNKALGNFRRQGLILIQEGNIIILDPDALRDVAS